MKKFSVGTSREILEIRQKKPLIELLKTLIVEELLKSVPDEINSRWRNP